MFVQYPHSCSILNAFIPVDRENLTFRIHALKNEGIKCHSRHCILNHVDVSIVRHPLLICVILKPFLDIHIQYGISFTAISTGIYKNMADEVHNRQYV